MALEVGQRLFCKIFRHFGPTSLRRLQRYSKIGRSKYFGDGTAFPAIAARGRSKICCFFSSKGAKRFCLTCIWLSQFRKKFEIRFLVGPLLTFRMGTLPALLLAERRRVCQVGESGIIIHRNPLRTPIFICNSVEENADSVERMATGMSEWNGPARAGARPKKLTASYCSRTRSAFRPATSSAH